MNQGSSHWNAKLPDKTVMAILAVPDKTKLVADMFGVNPRYVRKLRARQARKAIRYQAL